ncbi:MAG: putative Ig domain-containing protein [Gammaproteobacteria bacterium]
MQPSQNRAPQITGTPATTVQVGASYAFHPNASDADNDTLSFQISSRPAWASFDPASGTLTGTPASNNIGTNSSIVITVSDGTASVSLPAFSIQVQAAPPTNLSPTISGTPAASIVAGQAYSFQPSAADPNGDTLTFSISSKPAWATFNTSTGRLDGTPAAANVGSYPGIAIRVSDGATSVSLPTFSIQVQAAPQANLPPTISGTPSASVLAGQAYSFQPSAADPNSDALTFSISSKPAWATFSTSTGRLNGTPGAANVGSYTGIVIRVSDGTATVALAAFTITVTQVTNGTATMSWIPPTQNTDGSQLTDLAGYRIYYGTSASNLDQVVELRNPGLTSYMVENLSPATWYFNMRSISTDGTESEPSGIASKTIL